MLCYPNSCPQHCSGSHQESAKCMLTEASMWPQVAGRQCHVSWLVVLTPAYLLLLSNHLQTPPKTPTGIKTADVCKPDSCITRQKPWSRTQLEAEVKRALFTPFCPISQNRTNMMLHFKRFNVEPHLKLMVANRNDKTITLQ